MAKEKKKDKKKGILAVLSLFGIGAAAALLLSKRGEAVTPKYAITVRTVDRDTGQQISGQIFIDGQSIGFGMATAQVDAGTHEFSFGDVAGYYAPGPTPQNITEDSNIIARYPPRTGGDANIGGEVIIT